MTENVEPQTGRMFIELTIEDTLAFNRPELGTYVVNPRMPTKTNTWVYDVPAELVVEGVLSPAGLERIFAQLYGRTWRNGNSDGSRYTVINVTSRVVSSTDKKVRRLL